MYRLLLILSLCPMLVVLSLHLVLTHWEMLHKILCWFVGLTKNQ